MKKVKQVRSAMCTLHWQKDAYSEVPDWESLGFVKRAMGQIEVGDGGKEHWQIFVECKYPIDEKRLRGLGMHVDTRSTHKHPKAGRAYVRKPTPFVDSRFDWPEKADVFAEAVEERKRIKEERAMFEKMINTENKEIEKELMMELLQRNINECKRYLNKSIIKV